jgi:hypothetical protein
MHGLEHHDLVGGGVEVSVEAGKPFEREQAEPQHDRKRGHMDAVRVGVQPAAELEQGGGVGGGCRRGGGDVAVRACQPLRSDPLGTDEPVPHRTRGRNCRRGRRVRLRLPGCSLHVGAGDEATGSRAGDAAQVDPQLGRPAAHQRRGGRRGGE